jgi:hypothetical protein
MPGPESGDGREMETNGNPNSAANWHVMRVLRVDMVMRGGGMCDHMIAPRAPALNLLTARGGLETAFLEK